MDSTGYDGALLDLQGAATDGSGNAATGAQDQKALDAQPLDHLTGYVGVLGDIDPAGNCACFLDNQTANRHVTFHGPVHDDGAGGADVTLDGDAFADAKRVGFRQIVDQRWHVRPSAPVWVEKQRTRSPERLAGIFQAAIIADFA
jgi:hypothetical protein